MANIGELSIGVKVDTNAVRKMTVDIQKNAQAAGASLEKEIGEKGKKSLDEVGKGAKVAGDSLSGLKNIVMTVFGATAVYNFAKSIVTLASNLQQAQVGFTTMLGSADKAKVLLNDLSDFAKSTPFELVGIRENAKQLLAMGVAQENVIPTMKALGDVAAGLSVPLDRLALAYGQVLSKGKLTGDDLRQFTEAGVPLLAVLGKQLGKTTGEIQKMIEQGKISARDVTKAFETMSSSGGQFANLMAKQSETVAGKWSNLQDSMNSLGETVGTRLLPTFGLVVDGLGNVVKNYGTAIADVLASTFEYIGSSFAQLSQKTGEASKDQLTFGKVVLYVANVITSGFRTIFAIIMTLGKTIGAVFAAIVMTG